MKIVLLSTSFPRHPADDAGIFIARLVNALSENGVKGTVICPYDSKTSSEKSMYGWEIHRVKYGIFKSSSLAYGSGILPNLKANPLLIFQIPALLIAFFIAVISRAKNCNMVHANWIASALPGIFAARLLRKPVVVTVRGEDLKLLYLPIAGRILKFILGRADAITAVSESFVRKMQDLFPDKKIYFTPNGVSRVESDPERLEQIKSSLKLADKEYVIFAGRLIALKRIEFLIRLLSLHKNKELLLVLCGALNDIAYVQSLKDLAAVLGISDRIRFAGQVAPEDYLCLLAEARQYWSASEYEGRPNSVLEALVQSVPCILSDIPAHRDLITEGQNGLLFKVDEIQKTAEQIEAFNGFLQDSVLFSWDDSAEKYIEIYKICQHI